MPQLLKTNDINWLLLIIAGLFETGFATCLARAKETTGTVSNIWLGAFFVCLFVSMYLLNKAVDTLPMGTAYAVWTGIGAAGTCLMGIFFLNEPATALRLFFIATLIGSIVGLKVVSH